MSTAHNCWLELNHCLLQELQECFEAKDIPMLQQVVAAMPKEEAEYHIKRCVDSGLWVPGGAEEEGEPAEAQGEAANQGEAEYESLEQSTNQTAAGKTVEDDPHDLDWKWWTSLIFCEIYTVMIYIYARIAHGNAFKVVF